MDSEMISETLRTVTWEKGEEQRIGRIKTKKMERTKDNAKEG